MSDSTRPNTGKYSKPTSQAELLGHQARNAALKARFLEKGVDLMEARPIEFYFSANSQRDASVLGRSLYAMGFLIRLLAPAATSDQPDRWVVEAGARVSLAEALGDELTSKLVTLATSEDCEYDGCGASV